jgi:hypothetical protein
VVQRQGEPEPDYESRQHDILQFISKNPNCTKADVIKHMIGRSAVTTTHAILKEMIQEGKLNVYKKNLQTHLLTINEKNEFNKIKEDLTEIEKIIDNMDNTIEAFYKKHPELKKRQRGKLLLDELRLNFENYLFIDTSIGFSKILNRINAIKSEKDSRILYDKLVNVITKMYERSSKTLSWDMLDEGLDSVQMLKSMLLEDNLELAFGLRDK